MGERLRLGIWGIGGGDVIARLCVCEQLSSPRDIAGARAAGQQPVVADAVESGRQDVDEEAADELAGGERHELL